MAVTARAAFRFKRLRFVDGAFTLYMELGVAIAFTSVWFVCSLTGLIFNSLTVLSGTLILLIVFLLYGRGRYDLFFKDREGLKRFLLGFLAFSILFMIAVFIKGYKPSVDHQTEQYMDLGFMNAIFRQQKVPFEDIWAAGKKVNYYYLGQAAAVFMSRLSFVGPDKGYNYMLCMVFAGLTMSVFELTQAFLSSFKCMKKGIPVFAGMISGLLVSCGGNGHFIIYGLFKYIYRRIFKADTDYSYWFSDSTLFIGYDPDLPDKGKHEFPAYTLVLGDLHAHVCNMLFTIVLLAVLIDHILSADEGEKDKKQFPSHFLLMGLLLGLFRGVNYWDMPIYFVVCGAVILFTDIKKHGAGIRTFGNVLFKGLIIYITGILFMLPFIIKYDKPVSGVHICDRHSPLLKLFIIWFPFLVSSLLILIFSLGKLADKKRREKEDARDEDIRYLTVIAITLCGLGLILLPELIYVKDIYGDEFQRYNTMFKLTFQAFILLAFMTGTGIGLFFNEGLNRIRSGKPGKLYLVISLFAAGMSVMLIAYMPRAIKLWFGDINRTEYRQGISATDFIRHDPSYDDVREVLDIISSDKRRNIRLIEEAGTSYSPHNRISAFTGASCISGWFVHEWVWHNDSDDVSMRHGEVRYFYESGDEDYCRALIGKYDIDYIYVGSVVREMYDVDISGFEGLGRKVWENADEGYMLIATD